MVGVLAVTLFLGAAAAIAAGTVKAVKELPAFWKKIVKWTTECINTVKKVLKIIPVGVKTLIKKFDEGFKEIAEHYTKLDGNRYRKDTTITKELISDYEVPDDIRARAAAMECGRSIDISNECNRELRPLIL